MPCVLPCVHHRSAGIAMPAGVWNECCVLVDVWVRLGLCCLVQSLRTQQDLTWSTGLTELHMGGAVGRSSVRHTKGLAASAAWAV